MGTIAARDCLRVLELVEQVTAALLITVRQGVALRSRVQEAAPHAPLANMMQALESDIELIAEDRRLEPELRVLIERIRAQAWKLYA
jgi:histidine ammonia-lyase